MSKKTTEPTKKPRGSNKMRRRTVCDPRDSKKFRKSLSVWQVMNPAKRMTAAQKGAMIYLGELLTKESDSG